MLNTVFDLKTMLRTCAIDSHSDIGSSQEIQIWAPFAKTPKLVTASPMTEISANLLAQSFSYPTYILGVDLNITRIYIFAL